MGTTKARNRQDRPWKGEKMCFGRVSEKDTLRTTGLGTSVTFCHKTGVSLAEQEL